jgi:hypothetical protein
LEEVLNIEGQATTATTTTTATATADPYGMTNKRTGKGFLTG